MLNVYRCEFSCNLAAYAPPLDVVAGSVRDAAAEAELWIHRNYPRSELKVTSVVLVASNIEVTYATQCSPDELCGKVESVKFYSAGGAILHLDVSLNESNRGFSLYAGERIQITKVSESKPPAGNCDAYADLYDEFIGK